MQHASGGEVVFQAQGQLTGQGAFVFPMGFGVPLGAVHVVDGNERWLAALGQAHILLLEVGINLLAELVDLVPVLIAVRFSHPRVFMDTGDGHLVFEGHLGLVGEAADGRRRGRQRRTGQRNVPFAGEHARGGIETNPAGAGDIHLGPGMQVGKVHRGAAGPIQRLLVGSQLDQVTRNKTRCQTELTQDLHQQPGAVAARPRAFLQGFFRGLHPRFHAHQVADVLLQALVEGDQEIVDRLRVGKNGLARRRDPFAQQGAGFVGLQIGAQLHRQLRRIGEGKLLGVLLDEKVEGVDDGHVRHQVDRELQGAGLFRKDETADVVAVRVLLPIDKVFLRRHRQRVRQDRRARMGRRT